MDENDSSLPVFWIYWDRLGCPTNLFSKQSASMVQRPMTYFEFPIMATKSPLQTMWSAVS